MRTFERKLMIAALSATPFLAGWMIADRMTMQPESQLWIDGTSTVRDFKCTAGTMQADVATVGGNASAALIGGEKAVASGSFRVPVAGLDCKNGQMNEHMRKALKADKNPTVTFDLATYELLPSTGKTRATITGTLNLGGVTKPVTFDAELAPESATGVRMKGVYELRMSTWGLKAPSLMMGTMKVGDLVKVNFDLLLKN